MREFNVEKRNTHFIRVEKSSSSAFFLWIPDTTKSQQPANSLTSGCMFLVVSFAEKPFKLLQPAWPYAGRDRPPYHQRLLPLLSASYEQCVCVFLTVTHTLKWAPDVRRDLRFPILSYPRRLENLTLCKTVTAFVTFYKSSTFSSVVESPRTLVRPGFKPFPLARSVLIQLS